MIIDMVRKQLDRVYKEPFLCANAVSFNTNDSMVATGNVNGEITIRNLVNGEGKLINSNLGVYEPTDAGTSSVVLQHFERDLDSKCEVTQVRFSVVKRHVLASAYRNGQIVIWDTQGIFTKNPSELSTAAKKFVFAGHTGKPCSGIAFSQVNHLLLTSCGLDNRIHFYDITIGKEVKKIDINQNSSSNQSA